MSITEKDKKNFEMLVRALANQSLVLVSCTDRQTGEPVTCLCAALSRVTQPRTAADLKFMPLARLFQGDPADEVFVPNEAREAAMTGHLRTTGAAEELPPGEMERRFDSGSPDAVGQNRSKNKELGGN